MNKKKRRPDSASIRDESSDDKLMKHVDHLSLEMKKKEKYIFIFQIALFTIFVMVVNFYFLFTIIKSLQTKTSDELKSLEIQLVQLTQLQQEEMGKLEAAQEQISRLGTAHQEQSSKLELEQREQFIKLEAEQNQHMAKLHEQFTKLEAEQNQHMAKLHEQVTILGVEQRRQVSQLEAEQLKQFAQLGATSGQVAKTIFSKIASLTATQPLTYQNATNSSSLSSSPSCPSIDMYTLGVNYGTDKVTAHIYHTIYQRYFEPVRCEHIKLLEIGLGCDMKYGPGASYYLWLEYFPNAEIYFIESDVTCAIVWEKVDKRVHVLSGDQANATFLQEFVNKTGGEFDFIIDDGGHTMNQQITSFEYLFPALKPGGVYFIEDLLTSYIPWYNGGENVKNTTLNYIRDILGDLMSRRENLAPNKRPISNLVSRIDCIDENCAFTMKKENETLSS